jgi:Protein of unknown function (DUF1592)/Protein of unknown function (DUF1588)/Protein of unknown function (DUF1595)/Protein of unknown function (DUF1585)
LAINLAQLPRDGQAGDSFPEMDARTGQRHLETYLEVADKIAQSVASHDAQLTSLGGACALETPLDIACFRRFLVSFGARAWRRPLTVDELDRLLRLADGQAPRAAYELTIAELLAAPEFLFHIERGVASASAASAVRPLNAYELASRLSYHFWQSMPDDRLFQAAASGALDSAAGYRAEVLRLATQQRARATWYRFFREWLKLDDFGGFAQERAFTNFAGNLKPTPELYQDAVWEIEQVAGYYTFDTPGSYRDLLTSNAVVTRSPRLAKLYGVEPWDGRSLPAVFRADERGGLLTRAALMISASHNTNPFRRGAFVQRRLLCGALDPLVNQAPGTLTLPPFDPLASTRTRYEHKVEADECQFCHARFAPYGYVLEAYDALGRHRREERLLDDNGEYSGKVAVDERATVVVDQSEREVSGPIALGQILGASQQASECFVRQYFRFTFRRQEGDGDSCTLRELEGSLAAGGLLSLYRDIAFTDAFRSRVSSPSSEPSGDSR